MGSCTLINPRDDGAYLHLHVLNLIAGRRTGSTGRWIDNIDSNGLLFGHIYRFAKLSSSLLCYGCLICCRIMQLEIVWYLIKSILCAVTSKAILLDIGRVR